jgi:S1-C subfamily serine protease
MKHMTVIEDIAARVGPAVVGLRDGGRGGSGVVVAPGVVATLARNVREEARLVTADGAVHETEVLGVDPSVDLAVLRLEHDTGAVARWSDADAPPGLGREVYALADPAGGGLRVTGGTVASAPRGVRGPSGRLIAGVIEHTAPLPRGAGGGPLVDAGGAIVGLNALRRDGGLLLAWPATALRERAAALAGGTATAPRRLGLALVGARATRRMRAAVGLEDAGGLLVRGVQADSPAARAGIARGDVVVGAGGSPVARLDDLHAAIDAAGRAPLALEVLRGADRLTVEIEGEEVPA